MGITQIHYVIGSNGLQNHNATMYDTIPYRQEKLNSNCESLNVHSTQSQSTLRKISEKRPTSTHVCNGLYRLLNFEQLSRILSLLFVLDGKNS